MRFSSFLPLATATLVLAHSSNHQHQHQHPLHHHHHDLGTVCGSGAHSLDGDATCHSDMEYLAASQKDNTTQPTPEERRQCPHGADCDYQHKHAWTHSNQCFTSAKSGVEFCAFTDNNFADGRGTSFVMPARRADYIATSPAFTDPEVIAGVNQDLVRTIPAVYEMREFPGKGMGLVAAKPIRRGDLIMANTVSLVIDYRAFEDLPKDEYQQLQAFAVDNLPAAHRDAIMRLSTHFASDLPHVARVDKIAATNAFDIEPDADDAEQDHGFFVVFPEIARMNHDCRPNADYYFDHATLTQYIHATRDIGVGEEITLSYINPVMTRAARLRKLQRNWGFECACSACTQERALTEASDGRIRQINKLRGELTSWAAGSRASPAMAELFVSLHQQERLESAMYEAYAFAAAEYNGVGEPWTAIKYARLAVEWGIPIVGPKDRDVLDMEALAEDPWSHWSWMLRSKKRFGPGEKGEEDDDE